MYLNQLKDNKITPINVETFLSLKGKVEHYIKMGCASKKVISVHKIQKF